MKLIGPFRQIVTMDKLPLKGALTDDQLEIIEYGGILVHRGEIADVGYFPELKKQVDKTAFSIEYLEEELVAFPGFIDTHTHICWAGSRAGDYALRLAGKSYLEIAQAGGGIWNTVQKTRAARQSELEEIVIEHARQVHDDGVTTIEVKSGYGLSVADELKMLKAIKHADTRTCSDLIPTCLAAHICPKDFKGTSKDYLDLIVHELLPQVKEQQLAKRVDIFIENSAFSVKEARYYLSEAKKMDFDLVVHGDQFTGGGSNLAVEIGALSVDHLEASDGESIANLANSNVVAIVLPGASLGLGIPFAPARKLLDAGACLAIASDWNPGSAPMGDLLMQASLLGAYEKLTIAETLAGITYRAVRALRLYDRGILKKGNIADIVAFPVDDFREVIYRQGKLKPFKIWKNGEGAFAKSVYNK